MCEVHDEVACVSSMVLQIDNLYMLYIRVLLVFTLTARCRRKMTGARRKFQIIFWYFVVLVICVAIFVDNCWAIMFDETII